jgi:beta-fructofuranosidase
VSGRHEGGFARFADGRAVGDVIPFFHDGRYHLLILAPPEGALHYPDRLRTTWRHIVSDDLLSWEELPEALAPGPAGSADEFGIWTGSVLSDGANLHMFYTGVAAHGQQTICHATSTDAITWIRDAGNPVSESDGLQFERNDWRDPFVFWNPSAQCFWMLVTARRSGDVHGGAIVALASSDLVTWSEPEVIYEPFLTFAPECPEVFELDGVWVLGFSTFTNGPSTVYRLADNPAGPWRTPEPDALDGAFFYAAKGLTDDRGRRLAFGWVPDHDPEPSNAANPWLWGGDLALPRQITIGPDRRILAALPPELAAQTAVVFSSDGPSQVGSPGTTTVRTYTAPEHAPHSIFTATFDGLADVFEVGVAVRSNASIDQGIGVLFNPSRRSVRLVDLSGSTTKSNSEFAGVFDRYASLVQQHLEVSDGPVRFSVHVRGDVVEAFVGDSTCLTYRMTQGSTAQDAAAIVVDGSSTVGEVAFLSSVALTSETQ